MTQFRTWLAKQDKAEVFDSKDCAHAAALYAAGRGSEAEQAIAHLPSQVRAAIMELFEKGFPEPRNMDATARALADPKFQQWVQNRLVPTVRGTDKR